MASRFSVIGKKATVNAYEATVRKMLRGHVIENLFLENEKDT